MSETIKVKDLAEQLGLTVSVVNIHIGNGRAGDVAKVGEGETKEYALTKDNVITLLQWLSWKGRGQNKLKVIKLLREYKTQANV